MSTNIFLIFLNYLRPLSFKNLEPLFLTFEARSKNFTFLLFPTFTLVAGLSASNFFEALVSLLLAIVDLAGDFFSDAMFGGPTRVLSLIPSVFLTIESAILIFETLSIRFVLIKAAGIISASFFLMFDRTFFFAERIFSILSELIIFPGEFLPEFFME